MRTFNMEKIKCYDIEDRVIFDELRMEVFIDGIRKDRLEQKMKVGQTWNIDKKYTFEHHVVLKLWDKDPGPDDFLGQIIVNNSLESNKKQHFEPSPFSSYKLTYDVDPYEYVPMEKRAVLVASELSQTGDLGRLYEWLETNAMFLPENMLDSKYRKIESLAGPAMNSDTFVTRLKHLVEDDANEAVDLILAVHGTKEKICFHGGELITATNLCSMISQAIPGDKEKKRLRMVYSTACFGSTHTDNFVTQAGFRVACGARAICANTAIEYPAFLLRWGMGKTFKESLRINPVVNRAQDRIAQLINPEWNVDSTKVIFGDSGITITNAAMKPE